MTKARAGEAFSRLTSTPARTVTQQQEESSAPKRLGAVAPQRQQKPVRRFTVRVYNEAEDDAINQLRRTLREDLGRSPSASELAAAALYVANQPGMQEFRAALSDYLAGSSSDA